jgi:hypothetical protein
LGCIFTRDGRIILAIRLKGVTKIKISVTDGGMKVIGYIRVSTQGQPRSGYSLGYQEDEIKTYCKSHGYTLLRLFREEGISGAKVDEEALEVDRIGFQEMVKYLSTVTLSNI